MLDKSKMATVSEVKKLKVAELREELAEKGLNSKGNKQELVDRLTEYIEANGGGTGDADVLDNDGAETENRDPTDEEAGLLDQELEAITTEEEAAILDPDPKEDTVLEDEEKKSNDPDPPKLTPITPPQVAKETVEDKTDVSEIDKKKSRAERFSQPLTEDAKKAARAQRFGTPVVSPQTTTKATAKPAGVISSVSQAATPADVDKLKKRAARFGAVVSPVVEKSEQQARLLKRKERFGANTTTTTSSITALSSPVDAKKQKRAERFGI